MFSAKHIIIFVGILAVLCSCKYNKKNEEGKLMTTCEVNISLQNKQGSIMMSNFVDSVQTLCLELPSDVVIGRATRIFFYDSHIFILDRMQQKIFHFDINGTFLGELNRRGNGLGEYYGLHSCMVKDNLLYVFDKVGQNILLYDFSFKFIRMIHCEKWVENLFLLSDGSFLCFTPFFVYNAPNGIWQMSCDGKMMKQWYIYDDKYPYVGSEWDPFYITSSDGIGIRCPIRNEFYRYKDNNISCTMKWNIKERTTLDFPDIESCTSIKESFWTCPIFIDADEWVFGIWGEYNGAPSELFTLYSKKDNKVLVSSSLIVDVGDLSYIGNPVSSNLPNAMVAIIDGDLIMGSDSFKLDQVKSLPDNQVFLLIYYFLRQSISKEKIVSLEKEVGL